MSADKREKEKLAKLAGHDWYSFADLQALGVITNWQTMASWQRDHGFPTGRLFGPNSGRWSRSEINAWLASRPVARAEFEDAGAPPSPPHRGAKSPPRDPAAGDAT
jgi:predicted DNA-binding transcriptional regulator AlpA